MRIIKKSLINFFGNIRLYYGGIVFFGDSHYKLKGPSLRKILDLLQPGDIVLRRHDHYVSSMFIKGNFSHAGLYVGNNKVIHVIGSGILKEDILTFMRADAFAIVRFTNNEIIPKAVEKAYIQLGKNIEYDYDFDKNSPEQFYCSEFTDYCFDYKLRDNISKTFIYPDDYLVPSDFFKIIWMEKNK